MVGETIKSEEGFEGEMGRGIKQKNHCLHEGIRRAPMGPSLEVPEDDLEKVLNLIWNTD